MTRRRANETLEEFKTRRNTEVFNRYKELKQLTTCRETYPILATEYNISESTVRNILFNKNYSNSPLPAAPTVAEENSSFTMNTAKAVAKDSNQTACQLT